MVGAITNLLKHLAAGLIFINNVIFFFKLLLINVESAEKENSESALNAHIKRIVGSENKGPPDKQLKSMKLIKKVLIEELKNLSTNGFFNTSGLDEQDAKIIEELQRYKVSPHVHEVRGSLVRHKSLVDLHSKFMSKLKSHYDSNGEYISSPKTYIVELDEYKETLNDLSKFLFASVDIIEHSIKLIIINITHAVPEIWSIIKEYLHNTPEIHNKFREKVSEIGYTDIGASTALADNQTVKHNPVAARLVQSKKNPHVTTRDRGKSVEQVARDYKEDSASRLASVYRGVLYKFLSDITGIPFFVIKDLIFRGTLAVRAGNASSNQDAIPLRIHETVSSIRRALTKETRFIDILKEMVIKRAEIQSDKSTKYYPSVFSSEIEAVGILALTDNDVTNIHRLHSFMNNVGTANLMTNAETNPGNKFSNILPQTKVETIRKELDRAILGGIDELVEHAVQNFGLFETKLNAIQDYLKSIHTSKIRFNYCLGTFCNTNINQISTAISLTKKQIETLNTDEKDALEETKNRCIVAINTLKNLFLNPDNTLYDNKLTNYFFFNGINNLIKAPPSENKDSLSSNDIAILKNMYKYVPDYLKGHLAGPKVKLSVLYGGLFGINPKEIETYLHLNPYQVATIGDLKIALEEDITNNADIIPFSGQSAPKSGSGSIVTSPSVIKTPAENGSKAQESATQLNDLFKRIKLLKLKESMFRHHK
jgi:hypothetical protein